MTQTTNAVKPAMTWDDAFLEMEKISRALKARSLWRVKQPADPWDAMLLRAGRVADEMCLESHRAAGLVDLLSRQRTERGQKENRNRLHKKR